MMKYSYARCPICKMLVKVNLLDMRDKEKIPVVEDSDPELVAATLMGIPDLTYECEMCYQGKFKDYFRTKSRGVNG